MRFPTGIAVAALLLTGFSCSEAEAELKSMDRVPHPHGPTYKLNLEVDLTAILLGGMVTVGWFLGDELGPPRCAPLCDKGEVNIFDQSSAGYYNERWATVSSIIVGSTLATGLVTLFADHRSIHGFSDLLIVAESILLTNGFIVLTNLSTRRPRPYMYSQKAPEKVRNSGTAALSFPSGHVGATASLTTSMFSVLYARHPHSPMPWVFLGFGTLATAAVATGRVMAGRHFKSDVLVGATVGACIGILVPALHERNLKVAPMVAENTGGLVFHGTFF
jgi:membrane-associated phospholipid phosphatase